jgi:hypothetical protein
MDIAFLVFDGITALDVVGPYEVLARLPGARSTFVGPARGVVRTDNQVLGLSADASIDEIHACDVLVVPGGFATRRLEKDERLLAWLRAGIDLALALSVELAGREVAEAIQLGIEYDPDPPIHAGNADRATPAQREVVLERMRAREAVYR